MAYLAYPISKTHPPCGDIYHEHLPVIVTNVAEYEEIMGQNRKEFGCDYCRDADTIVITLGPSQCGVWLEADVLLDTLPSGADAVVERFELSETWFWDWQQDYHGPMPADQAIHQPPRQVR